MAGQLTTTEANTQIYPRFDFTAKELTGYISANTNGVLGGSINLRDNGSDSLLGTTFIAGATGNVADASNSVAITSGTDEIDFQLINLDVISGNITWRTISILGETAGGTPVVSPPGNSNQFLMLLGVGT